MQNLGGDSSLRPGTFYLKFADELRQLACDYSVFISCPALSVSTSMRLGAPDVHECKRLGPHVDVVTGISHDPENQRNWQVLNIEKNGDRSEVGPMLVRYEYSTGQYDFHLPASRVPSLFSEPLDVELPT
jgi:hypothetical protein